MSGYNFQHSLGCWTLFNILIKTRFVAESSCLSVCVVFICLLTSTKWCHAKACSCVWVCLWVGGYWISVIKHSSSSASFPCQPACLGIERGSACLLQRLHSFNRSLLIDGRWVVTYCSLLWPVAVWGYSQLWVDILSVTQAVCVFLGMPETPNYPLSPRIVVFGT